MIQLAHERLPCGIEYGVVSLPRRHVVSFQIMVFAGAASEPAERLGLARILEETIDKGTELYSGRELSDQFDAIGASVGAGAGRETTTFSCTVLPEHFERAVELHAEMLRRPTFPEDACAVNLELARQELTALEDDPSALMDKLISPSALGTPLGRHPLGERETLDALTRDHLLEHWKEHFHAGAMLVAVAGPLEPQRVADTFEKHFAGFGDHAGALAGRTPWPATFTPGNTHHLKELEQEQIGICWPGVGVTHDDYPIQRVMLGILSGGMSSRLFTEVREKLGLVYSVQAWHETPRGCGMIFLGASSTPENCAQAYNTMLREVDRLAEDIEPDELERAITGIVAGNETRGDLTRARCGEMANDLFHFGHPVPTEEKMAKVQAVSMRDVKNYLARYSRDSLCVVTLGPTTLDPS